MLDTDLDSRSCSPIGSANEIYVLEIVGSDLIHSLSISSSPMACSVDL